MAYRRRRTIHRRNRRKAFSKRQVKAIKSISQIPVETKHYPNFGTLTEFLNSAGYISGPSLVFASNVYARIPRENNTLTKSEFTFEGNEIQSRGFRWEFKAYTVAATPGASLDIMFRYTLFSIANYAGADAFGIAPNDTQYFDTDHGTVPTWSKWNVQNVTIHTQKMFRLNNDGNLNGMVSRKFYTPLRRKVTAAIDASVVINDYMFETKNRNTYWALEIFAPGFLPSGDIRTYLNGQIDTNIYFKDA